MRMQLAICLCVLGVRSSVGFAQDGLEHPDQFYTNGEKVDSWTRNEQAELMSTFWFARNPVKSLGYRQQIVIVYDDQPDKAYYFDSTTKKFVGRMELDSGKYSMLDESDRRERIEDIDEAAFPVPGDMPAIGDMFGRLEDGSPGNPKMMMMAPPTMKFPRFEDSTWDTSYMTTNRQRIRATVQFDGNKGTYQLIGTNTTGRLFNVRYKMNDDDFRITGTWILGNSRGPFQFVIPQDNMDVFWGEWGYLRGRTEGSWDGIRKAR